MAWPRVVATAAAPCTVVVACTALTAQIVAGSAADSVEVAFTAAVALCTAALSVVVAVRAPANVVAAVLGWMGLLASVVGFSDTYRPAQLRAPDTLPALPTPLAAALPTTWVWLYASLGLLVLLFPTGRVHSPGWRWTLPTLLADALVIQVVVMATSTPYDPPYADLDHPFGDLPDAVSVWLRVITFPALVLLMLAAGWSLVVRYRAGGELLRRQVKWLVLALPLLPLTILLSWIGYWLLGTHALAGVGLALLYAAVPLAATIAIVRHDLFDVDRAVAEAATYSVLSLGVVGSYVGAAALSGATLGRQSPVVAALVTAAVAVALAPARRRIQQVVDRLLYPMRRRVLEAVGGLEQRVNAGRARPEELQTVLRTALGGPGIRVGMVVPGGSTLVDPDGRSVDADTPGQPVVLQGQRIGAISGAPEVPHGLLREVAARSALLVEMARLRLEANRALEEARASRARLQKVGYDERRRLERDLHDVAQQRLVSLGLSMRLAQRRLDGGGELTRGETSELMGQWVAEVTRSTSELRDLAHGIRPSCLDEGLQPALTMLTHRVPLPLDARIAALGELSDAISTTAYHVAAEAITNALRHSAATHLELDVHEADGRLVVRVRDDGHGGAVVQEAGGLGSLRDRVAAAGGVLRLSSAPGSGTTVEAELPCAS